MQFACSSHVVDTYHRSVVLMCDMKDKVCLLDLFYFLFFDSSLLFFFAHLALIGSMTCARLIENTLISHLRAVRRRGLFLIIC